MKFYFMKIQLRCSIVVGSGHCMVRRQECRLETLGCRIIWSRSPRCFRERLGLVIQLLVHDELAEEVVVELVIIAVAAIVSILVAASIRVTVPRSRLSLVDQRRVVNKPAAVFREMKKGHEMRNIVS